MEKINMSGIKIDNVGGVGAVNASANQLEIKREPENTSEDMLKPSVEAPKSKHVVTYIGCGEYKDSTGHMWHRNDEQTYDDNEYANRKDLHFMVEYGEMKHTVVTV